MNEKTLSPNGTENKTAEKQTAGLVKDAVKETLKVDAIAHVEELAKKGALALEQFLELNQ